AELFSLLRVRDGVFERTPGEAEHLRSDSDPSFVEGFDRHFVALAHFAQHVGARDAAIFHDQLARAARADAELVLLLADSKAGEAALDQKRGDAAVPYFRIDRRE